MRTELAGLLNAAGYAVRSFDSGERFLEEYDAETPGCVLLDAVLGGMNGLELQSALADLPLPRPVILLVGRGQIESCVLAMKRGAVDVLSKPVDRFNLFDAVERALRLDVEWRRNKAVKAMIDARLESLTPRERQVMEQVTAGRLNKQIACHLGRGEKVVKAHRARMMRKMGAASVADLVRLVTATGNRIEPVFCMTVAAPKTDLSSISGRSIRRRAGYAFNAPIDQSHARRRGRSSFAHVSILSQQKVKMGSLP